MYIPHRTCIVCRNKQPKTQLLRIIKNNKGEIKVDFTGKLEGRGAYICKNQTCHNKLIKNKALNKTFRQNISADSYQKVLDEINQTN